MNKNLMVLNLMIIKNCEINVGGTYDLCIKSVNINTILLNEISNVLQVRNYMEVF